MFGLKPAPTQPKGQTVWFWWLLLTLIYFSLGFSIFEHLTLTYIIGLFVPISFLSLIGMLVLVFSNPVIIFVIPALLVGLYFVNRISALHIKNVYAKIIWYLVALFVLTFLVDNIVYTCWQSYQLVRNPDTSMVCGSRVE